MRFIRQFEILILVVQVAETKAIFEVLWHRQPTVAKRWTPSEFQRFGLTAQSLLSKANIVVNF